MIKSFSDKTTESIFNGIYTHRVRIQFPGMLVKEAQRKLDLLNSAESLESLQMIPSIKGEAAVRDAHGKYSIPIDRERRLAFGWNDGPEHVEIKSY
jgi:proteic killer suppression protein